MKSMSSTWENLINTTGTERVKQVEEINVGRSHREVGELRLNIMFIRPGQRSYLKQAKKQWMMWAGVVNGLLQQICWEVNPSSRYHYEEARYHYLVWGTVDCASRWANCTTWRQYWNEAVQIRKNECYENLIEKCEEAGWSVKHFPVEVGCRVL